MNSRLRLVVLLLFAAAGGGLWTWWQRQEFDQRQAHVDTLASRPAPRPTPAAPVPPPVEVTLLPIPREPPTPAPTIAATPPPPMTIELRKLDADPRKAEELKKLDALETRASLDRNYASVYLALENVAGVTPDQIDQLKSLLAQKRDVGLTALNQPDFTLSAEAQGLAQNLAAAEDAIDEQIKQTIGERGFSLYLEEKRILPQRKATELVVQSLTASPEALNAGQRDQLAAILAKYPAPGENLSRTEFTSLFNFAVTPSTITDAAIKAAEPVLSPAQLRALQEVQTQQKTQGQLFDWLDRLQRPANPAPAAAP